MPPDHALEARGIEKSYGPVRALRGVDLTIAPGEVLALLGHNGAGKTTLVSLVAGLRRPDAGWVHVDGIDVAADPLATRRRLGLAPQENALYPIVSARENLRVFGALAGLRGRVLRERIEEAAVAFSLDGFMDRPVEQLSGGQRRRVHTAAAVLHRPPLLLLDEPTVGADVETRDALLELVRGLARDGHAVCYSTHYLPEVEALGASVAVLERGRLIARGTINELVAAHASSAVELIFDGPAPALDGADVEGGVARIPARDPARAAATILAELPTDVRAQLQSVELVRDDLESAYRALTGRDAGHAGEVAHEGESARGGTA